MFNFDSKASVNDLSATWGQQTNVRTPARYCRFEFTHPEVERWLFDNVVLYGNERLDCSLVRSVFGLHHLLKGKQVSLAIPLVAVVIDVPHGLQIYYSDHSGYTSCTHFKIKALFLLHH